MNLRLKAAKLFGVSAMVLAVSAMAITPILAQPPHGEFGMHEGKRGHCGNKEMMSPEKREALMKMMEEMGEYKNATIIPQMLEWKQELERNMTEDNLQKLEKLRAEMKSIHSERHEAMKAMREAMREVRTLKRELRNDSESAKEELRERSKELRKQMREHREAMREEREDIREQSQEIREQVAMIAEEYKAELERIGDDFEVQSETWEEEIRKIKEAHMENFIGEDSTVCNEMKKRRRKRGSKRSFRRKDIDEKSREAMEIRFLLWDGTDPMSNRENTNLRDGTPTSVNNFGGMLNELGLRSFPNPANEQSEVRFNLLEDGNVTLKVFDLNGNVVKTVIDKQLNAGEHEVNFSTVGLQNGAYYYRLVTNSGTITKSFFIQK